LHFLTRESTLGLLGTLLLGRDGAWAAGKRFFDTTPNWGWQREASV